MRILLTRNIQLWRSRLRRFLRAGMWRPNALGQRSFRWLISETSDADKFMKVSFTPNERGNVLLCAVCTIFVVSLIAANVLLNCTARYNQASNQVRSWNEALYAAESGGDIAYSEVRKLATSAWATAFSASNGWTTSGTTYTSGTTTFGTNGLRTNQTVALFYSDPTSGNAWYRIRSKGISPLHGLKRTGMDDRLSNGNRFAANGATRGFGESSSGKI